MATQNSINNRIKRYGGTTNSANPVINTDLYSVYSLTAQTDTIASFTTNLSGAPAQDDELNIKITRATNAASTLVGKTNYYYGLSRTVHPVALPAGTTNGDIMFTFCSSEVAFLSSVPAGWTLLAKGQPGKFHELYYRVASGEGASYDWTYASNSNYPAITTIVYRGGFNTSSPIDVISNSGYTTSDSNVVAGSMKVTTPNSNLFFFAGIYWGGGGTYTKPTTPVNSWTEDSDVSGGSFGQEVCSLQWASSGDTGTMTAVSSRTLTDKQAFAVALKQAPVAITWGAKFVASTYSTLPTSVLALDINFKYDSVAAVWKTFDGYDILSATAGVADSPSASQTDTITHGLGKIPRIIRINGIGSFVANASATPTPLSMGVYTVNSGNKCVYMQHNGTVTTSQGPNSTSSFAIYLSTTAGSYVTGVIQNLTATTFDIVWTETGTATAQKFVWEVQ